MTKHLRITKTSVPLIALSPELKYERVAQVGDTIRAWDAPKGHGGDNYAEGIVTYKGDIELPQCSFRGYTINVTRDTCFTEKPRKVVYVPFEGTFEFFESRVELV